MMEKLKQFGNALWQGFLGFVSHSVSGWLFIAIAVVAVFILWRSGCAWYKAGMTGEANVVPPAIHTDLSCDATRIQQYVACCPDGSACGMCLSGYVAKCAGRIK